MKKLAAGVLFLICAYLFGVIASDLYQKTETELKQVKSKKQLGEPLDPLMPADSDQVCKNQLNADASLREQEQAMACLINKIRIKYGAQSLLSSKSLNESAYAKAEDIIRCQDFSHQACGNPFIYHFQQSGFTACKCNWGAGENLAWAGNSQQYSSTESPRALANAWLNSPPHRKALLSSEWTAQGLGLIKTEFNKEKYSVVWVSHFGFQE